MGHVIGDPTGEARSFFKFEGGVFVDKPRIVAVEDVSGEVVGKNDFVPEIGLIVTLDIGMDFQPKMYLFGKFQRDKKTGEVKGWTKYNDVGIFLARLLGEAAEVNNDWSIPEKTLKRLIGLEFWRLKYISGTYNDNPNYQNFTRVAAPSTDPNALFTEFQERAPFLKDYTPEIWEDLQRREKEEKDSFNPSQYSGAGQAQTADATVNEEVGDII